MQRADYAETTVARIPDEFIPPLWEHQKQAVARALSRYALFFDPGTGKTRTAIELYRKSLAAPRTMWPGEKKPGIQKGKVLILAPLNVCRNWAKEIEKYLCLPHKVWLVSGQTKPVKLRILRAFQAAFDDCHCFLICNTESLRSKEYREILAKCGASFVILDESHYFKSPTSLQTKGLFNVIHSLSPNYLYLLTGTPAPQGEIDLWSTFALLGKTNDTFFVWRKKFFDDKNERRRGTASYWPDYQIRPTSREFFQKLLAECSSTAKKDLVLDLPPLLHTTIHAEMGVEQKRHYETMFEYLFAIDKDGHELNATNLLSRTLRLQQILAGFLGDTPVKENPRLQALDAAIEKVGNWEQFIVWTIFKTTYRDVAKRLEAKGITFGMLTGEQPAAERFRTIEAFQKGDLRAVIAHPKAGGVGISLSAAPWSITYTRNYSLVDMLQSEARNYRGGSEVHKRITRVDIVTPDTIDEEIVEALRGKKSVQDFILGLKEKYGY